MPMDSCILFCRCNAQIVSSEKLNELADGLKNFEADVFELQDLCALTVHEKDVLNTIGKNFERKIIVACYPRAIKNMLRQNGIEFGSYDVLNFRELTSSEIFSKLKNDYQISRGEARYQVQISDLEVPAWFPVIDESRCNLCGKCARFCLFGVYSYNKKSLKVVDPLACKDKCPACGRTCPTQAIMFPRIDENTVLAGAEPGEKKVSIDKGSLLTTLNQRNQNRQNIFRQGVVQKAEEERNKAIAEFKLEMERKKKDD
jgi:heterodisulfide reductase subunit A-like polyferredoxin